MKPNKINWHATWRGCLQRLGVSVWCGALLVGNAWGAKQSVMAPDANLSSSLGKTPNETRGQRIFELRCQQCHQANATGSAAQKIPSLAGQQYEYLVKQVVDFLDLQRDNSTMHRQLTNSADRKNKRSLPPKPA